MTPMENINLQIDVYLNSRLLENFRLSSLRRGPVLFHKTGLFLFNFGIWPILMIPWVIHFIGSVRRDPKLGMRENKE